MTVIEVAMALVHQHMMNYAFVSFLDIWFELPKETDGN